jgi:biopolymer transport protein ExbB
MQTFSRHGGWALALWAGVLCAVIAAPVSAWAFQNDPATDPLLAADPGGVPAAPVVAEPAAPVRTGPESTLEWMVRTSGVFGYLLLLLSLVLGALILYQLLQLRRDNYLPAAFLEQFERLLNDKNYQAAYEAARSDESFMAKVLAAGMARLSRGYDDVLKGMQEVGDEELMTMEQSIGYLALIASVAPMLGLLGTVEGLVETLQVIAQSTTSPRPHLLADGVATALFTTFAGLAVALPALVCHSLFKNRLANFVRESGAEAEELMQRFRQLPKGFTAPIARPTVASAVPAPHA